MAAFVKTLVALAVFGMVVSGTMAHDEGLQLRNMSSRRLLSKFDDIEFANGCNGTAFNVAIGSYVNKQQFKSIGWMNLLPKQSQIIKVEFDGADEFGIFVNFARNVTDFCKMEDSDVVWNESKTSTYCINGKSGFEIISTLDEQGKVVEYRDTVGKVKGKKTCEELGECFQNKVFYILNKQELKDFFLKCDN